MTDQPTHSEQFNITPVFNNIIYPLSYHGWKNLIIDIYYIIMNNLFHLNLASLSSTFLSSINCYFNFSISFLLYVGIVDDRSYIYSC